MIHFPFSFTDRSMNTTPWFHRGGLHSGGITPTLYAGGTVIIQRKFQPEKTLDMVQQYGLTFLIGVPNVLELLAEAQQKQPRDLSSLRGIVTMGSPLERADCIRYQKILTKRIFNGYGTTETFWNTFLRPDDLPEMAGSAGRSCVDDDVRVIKVYEDRVAEPDDLAATDGSEVEKLSFAPMPSRRRSISATLRKPAGGSTTAFSIPMIWYMGREPLFPHCRTERRYDHFRR